ncbi:hypothetical protein ACFPPD_01840 [Cohnella suwonensis]|uniref:DUF4190 domain-containing protein n=1 Tax=Cohnella suwonensis TaxID=696072 RepID=A0ABW0LQ44_9BACL
MNGDPRSANKNGHGKDFALGFFGCIGLHVVVAFVFLPAAIVIGITQVLYVLPLAIAFRRRTGFLQGLLIAAAVTFLLNAACFGFFIFGFS